MKHSNGVWVMRLSWSSLIHRSCQTRMVRLIEDAPTHISVIDCIDLSLLPLLDDFPESTGIKRIIQALNANVWSNVKMKDGETITPLLCLKLNYFNCVYNVVLCHC